MATNFKQLPLNITKHAYEFRLLNLYVIKHVVLKVFSSFKESVNKKSLLSTLTFKFKKHTLSVCSLCTIPINLTSVDLSAFLYCFPYF